LKPKVDAQSAPSDLLKDALARWSRHELVAVLHELRVALASARRILLRSRHTPERLDVRDEPAVNDFGAGALDGPALRMRRMRHLAQDLNNPLLFETLTSLKE
jgi:hypothetical protein